MRDDIWRVVVRALVESHDRVSSVVADAIEAAEAVGLRPPWRSYSQAHFSHADLL